MPETAESVLNDFQQTDSGKPRTAACLLKSLLDAHVNNPEHFGIDDVMAISMGAMYGQPTCDRWGRALNFDSMTNNTTVLPVRILLHQQCTVSAGMSWQIPTFTAN
jgi:hypothetical protein